MNNPFRRRRETLTQFQARIARQIGYVPLVFGTSDEQTGRVDRRWWNGKEWKK